MLDTSLPVGNCPSLVPSEGASPAQLSAAAVEKLNETAQVQLCSTASFLSRCGRTAVSCCRMVMSQLVLPHVTSVSHQTHLRTDQKALSSTALPSATSTGEAMACIAAGQAGTGGQVFLKA